MHSCFLKPAEQYKSILRVLCEQAEAANFGIRSVLRDLRDGQSPEMQLPLPIPQTESRVCANMAISLATGVAAY